MSIRWRVIDCSQFEGTIRSARGAIVVTPFHGDDVAISVADVAVVLVGIKVRFSAAVMHRLLTNDIAVIFCDWAGVPQGASYAWSTHNRVAARHRAQATLTLPRQKNAWGRLIKAKIRGQLTVLKDHNRSEAHKLEALASLVRSGDPHNCEAQAARIYWQSLWGAEGFTRVPGAGESTRNSQLDYAYTVLRGHGIRAVIGAGLSPTIGIFHRQRNNNFALVDDLIEPFRPAIDDSVAELDSDASMDDPETRKYLVACADKKFLQDGRTISSAFDELAQKFGQYVEGAIQTLPVEEWKGCAIDAG